MSGPKRGERFFLVMGLVSFAIVVAGFAPPVFTRPGGVLSIPLLLHVHGAVFVGWFVLFCVQAGLIGSGNVRLHRRLGGASIVLASAMVVLGYFVIRGAYSRPDWTIAGLSPTASVMFPFTDVVNFVIAYGLALANRRVPDAHKRLMLVAGILILDPAVARLITTVGAPVPVILLIEIALLGALLVYDMRTRRRPHWASLLGLGLFVAALAAKVTVARTAGWAAFVDAVFG